MHNCSLCAKSQASSLIDTVGGAPYHYKAVAQASLYIMFGFIKLCKLETFASVSLREIE